MNPQPDFIPITQACTGALISLRYASTENFVGRALPGYESMDAFLTPRAAEALARVQNRVHQDGFELVIYDSYRPQRTVDAFKAWSKDVSDDAMQSLYYPYFDKRHVFEGGYLASRSPHSRGSTVDLTLIDRNASLLSTPQYTKRELCDGRVFTYIDDATMDTFTHFDLMDDASQHGSNLVPKAYQEPRFYLKNIMEQHGFGPYSKEWWHYQLRDEPYPQTFFDWVPSHNFTS